MTRADMTYDERQLATMERNLERARNRKVIAASYRAGWPQADDEIELIAMLTVQIDELRERLARRGTVKQLEVAA